jgi:hypothetical protein
MVCFFAFSFSGCKRRQRVRPGTFCRSGNGPRLLRGHTHFAKTESAAAMLFSAHPERSHSMKCSSMKLKAELKFIKNTSLLLAALFLWGLTAGAQQRVTALASPGVSVISSNPNPSSNPNAGSNPNPSSNPNAGSNPNPSSNPNSHATPAASPATPSAEQIWAELMQGKERFVAGTPTSRNLVGLRASLTKSQHPNVMVLACSDSRVAPELLFDQSLGDLFVIRAARATSPMP